MSSLLKELSDILDLKQLEESVNLSKLLNSEEFKAINKADSKIGNAIKLQWGYPEFMVYMNKVMAGIAKKDSAYKSLTPDLKLDLSRLVRMHTKEFPKVEAPKAKSEIYKWNDENTDIRTKRMECLDNLKAGLTESQFDEFCENLQNIKAIVLLLD